MRWTALIGESATSVVHLMVELMMIKIMMAIVYLLCYSWKAVENYIDDTFEQYVKDECGISRKNINDRRVHCCLYFISPYGRG